MTQEQKTKISEHFDELHATASGLASNVSDDLKAVLRACYLAGADYALDMFAPQWISVQDELPEYDQRVLWCWDDGLISIGRVALDEKHIEAGYITHWMPLPAPPVLSNSSKTVKQSKFDENCEKYRTVFDGWEDLTFEERRDRINKFRSGQW